MKKHLFILGLALALFNVGCDDQNTIPNGYVQTTQEGASTLVLKGYENAALGFSVFNRKDLILRFIYRIKVCRKRLQFYPGSSCTSG